MSKKRLEKLMERFEGYVENSKPLELSEHLELFSYLLKTKKVWDLKENYIIEAELLMEKGLVNYKGDILV